MSPAMRAAIDAAIDLAWRPTANLPGSLAYGDRKESATRLCERLAAVRLSANASPELRFLVAAMRRVAGCSFSNRRGEPYYARRRGDLRAARLPRCVPAIGGVVMFGDEELDYRGEPVEPFSFDIELEDWLVALLIREHA